MNKEVSDQLAPKSYPLMSGIAGRLLGAFMFLAVLPLITAAVVWISHSYIQAPLDTATDRNLEFVNLAVEASQLAARVFSLAVTDTPIAEEERANQSRSLNTALESLAVTARKLDALSGRDEIANEPVSGVPGRTATETKVTFAALADDVSRQAGLLSDLSLDIADNRRKIIELREDVEGIATRISNRSLVLVDDGLQDRSIGREEQSLVELRFGVRSLAVIAATITDNQLDREIDIAAADYTAILRDLVFELSSVRDEALRQELAQDLAQLYDLGVSENGLFGHVRLAAAGRRDRQRVREDMQSLRQTLNQRFVAEEFRNTRLARSLMGKANTALITMRTASLITALTSVLFALAIAFFYVYKNLLERLRSLSDATARLSRGELSVPVDSRGNDELTVIAEALEVFRENSKLLAENQRALVARTAELVQVNNELDKFAYVASHDLRAPLRAVENLVGFIREDLGDTLPEANAKHLGLMTSRISRLDALLTSLLEYSRVGRDRQPVQKVPVRRLVEETIEIIASDRFSFEVIGEEFEGYTYRTPLEQVLRNLLDNAQKHHDLDTGVIQVRLEPLGSKVRFSIKDDGPGIPAEFHERIFGMFQTLKPRDDTEGSGMGLAILQKLATSFGATIVVESDPEVSRGTCFVLEWPIYSSQEYAPEFGQNDLRR